VGQELPPQGPRIQDLAHRGLQSAWLENAYSTFTTTYCVPEDW